MRLTSDKRFNGLIMLSRLGLFTDSWGCDRAGGEVSRLQASVWTVQSGERGDRGATHCNDRLGK